MIIVGVNIFKRKTYSPSDVYLKVTEISVMKKWVYETAYCGPRETSHQINVKEKRAKNSFLI